LTSILTMLASSGARMVFGEISSWWTKRQDHAQELDRMGLQMKLDQQAHENRMAMAKFEADNKVQIIRIQSEMDVAKLGNDLQKLDAETWGQAVIQAMKPVGVWFVDAWNAAIRPAAATMSLLLWAHSIQVNKWVLVDQDWQIIFAVLGFFFADRTMAKRGK
jgi:hypothetical protein